MESVNITGKEYEKQYIPFGGFLFIAKDLASTKHGSIYIPEKVRSDHSKYTSTGVIVAKSPFKNFEDEREQYMMARLKKGDRVGFGTTVPLYSPSPPFYQFDGDDRETYITIHVKDILAVICDTHEKWIEFMERFNG